MSTEGLKDTSLKTQINVKSTNKDSRSDKLSNSEKKYKKVDINILKARVQEVQDKENKKNLTIFISFILAIGVLVFYLSA